MKYDGLGVRMRLELYVCTTGGLRFEVHGALDLT